MCFKGDNPVLNILNPVTLKKGFAPSESKFFPLRFAPVEEQFQIHVPEKPIQIYEICPLKRFKKKKKRRKRKKKSIYLK